MTVQQISIFVENKSGTLLQVLELFKEAQIQLIASTISDTVEYGIYRIICSEPARGLETLRQAGISADVSDVFAIELDNIPGRAADAVRLLSEAGIGISYLYSFLLAGKGILIFRTDNPEKTERVITEKGLRTLDDRSLLSLV
ncbi:MAG TPA: amino acid-binding protein [Candidatus Alistipes intestinipullorum]|nr:amino acid-binding protein [Candidatus Alistipes intestinipullorum]